MIDFSYIGQDAFVIQYEDLISLIGFNAVKYLKSIKDKDIATQLMLDYINRPEYDILKFVQDNTGYKLTLQSLYDSDIACQYNLAYAFKMMQAASQNGLTKLYVHSNEYSPIIEKNIGYLEIQTNYVHGDILPVLHNLPNCTYTTSCPDNIRKCMNADVPFALTIVDDFQYLAPIVLDNQFIQRLREKNVYVQFTGVISAGLI